MKIMLIISVIVLVMLAAGFIIACQLDSDEGKIITGVFLILPLTFICLGACSANESPEKKLYDIRSVKLNSEVEGGFVFGSGTIKETLYYYVMRETDKGLNLVKLNASETYIIETDEFNPQVTVESVKWELVDVYRMYVPIGSVQINYDVF